MELRPESRRNFQGNKILNAEAAETLIAIRRRGGRDLATMLLRDSSVSDTANSSFWTVFMMVIPSSPGGLSRNGPIVTGEVSKCARTRQWKRVCGRELRGIDSVNRLSKQLKNSLIPTLAKYGSSLRARLGQFW